MNGSQVSGSAGQGRDLIGGKSLAAEDRKVRITRVFDNRRTNTSADQDENDGGLRQGLTGSNPTVNRLRNMPNGPIIFIWMFLITIRSKCHCRPILPNYLVDQDFVNARFVKSNNRPVRVNLNDQRFRKRHRRGSVVALESDKWPNGRIPYVLSAAYSPRQRAILAKAIAAYNAKTCIRFVPKTPLDKDYVDISKLDGCYADFARVGGKQQVSLADECIEYATIIHEFMHVIGFIHEHQRQDRDGFVQIVWDNVIDGASADFEKLSAVGLSNYGETYDYFSIMHYESTEGSKNGRPTIMANVPGYTSLMGKSTDFTEGDLNRVNKAYRCYGNLLRKSQSHFFNRRSTRRPQYTNG